MAFCVGAARASILLSLCYKHGFQRLHAFTCINSNSLRHSYLKSWELWIGLYLIERSKKLFFSFFLWTNWLAVESPSICEWLILRVSTCRARAVIKRTVVPTCSKLFMDFCHWRLPHSDNFVGPTKQPAQLHAPFIVLSAAKRMELCASEECQ